MLLIQNIVSFFQQTFYRACIFLDDIEPVFREAAEGEGDGGGGATYHGWAPIGLPGAKFHAMTGQMEKSHDVRRARAEARNFRSQAMDRPDYYSSFEKTNNFKM